MRESVTVWTRVLLTWEAFAKCKKFGE